MKCRSFILRSILNPSTGIFRRVCFYVTKNKHNKQMSMNECHYG